MRGGGLLVCWGHRVHILLGGAVPEHVDPIVLHPMLGGLLREPCERRNELHELHDWELLRHGGANLSHGALLDGTLRIGGGGILHLVLGGFLPEYDDPVILYSMRRGLLYKPTERCNELYELHVGQLLRHGWADGCHRKLFGGILRVGRGVILYVLLGWELSSRCVQVCMRCLSQRSVSSQLRATSVLNLSRGDIWWDSHWIVLVNYVRHLCCWELPRLSRWHVLRKLPGGIVQL